MLGILVIAVAAFLQWEGAAAQATDSEGRIGCAPKPSRCGYPDAANTGVSRDLNLKKVPDEVTSGRGWHWDTRGWVTINGEGALFAGYQVDATVDIVADNVTVRDVLITVAGDTFGIAIRHARNTLIERSQIGPDSSRVRLLVGIKDIYGDAEGTQIIGNDISNTATGIQIYSGLIQDNYIHDMGFKEGDHTNGTTSNGSTRPLIIRHNTIFNQLAQTDAVSLFQDFGIEANRVIDDNLLAGGGYTIYAGQNEGAPTPFNIKVTNNRISRTFFGNGGYWGPVTAYNRLGEGNEWSNNVWDETNTIIAEP